MTLVRWRPTRDLPTFPTDILNIQREFNRMFNGFFRGSAWDEDTLVPTSWTPSVDVAEHDNEYVVNVELPGVSKDDVNITMQDSVLTIRGEKKEE